jgi:hypothetical protein
MNILAKYNQAYPKILSIKVQRLLEVWVTKLITTAAVGVPHQWPAHG